MIKSTEETIEKVIRTEADELVFAHEMLVAWGIHTTGGRLKSAGIWPGGPGADGFDEGAMAARFVESTPGFSVAHPALLHVFGEGKPPSSMYWRCPGETKTRALLRLRWLDYANKSDREIPALVIDRFSRELARRIAEANFTYPVRTKEGEDPIEIGERAAKELREAARDILRR